MRPTLAVVLLCLIGLAAPSALTQSTAGSPGEVRSLLLRPAGWIYEWKPSPTNKNSPSNVGETGNGEMVFEVRGNAIVATIRNLTLKTTCTSDVTLAGDVVMFNLCYDRGIRLRFDPADHDFPFKGGSEMYDNRLKPK